MEKIYHYTSMLHLEIICKDGYLKTSDAERRLGVKKPALWFSKNTVWEPTATKMLFDGTNIIHMTLEEQLRTIGMARFTIPFSNELVSWAKYRHVSKIEPGDYSGLAQIGIEKGAKPSDWYCSFKMIPLTRVIAIEEFDGSSWDSIFEEESAVDQPSIKIS